LQVKTTPIHLNNQPKICFNFSGNGLFASIDHWRWISTGLCELPTNTVKQGKSGWEFSFLFAFSENEPKNNLSGEKKPPSENSKGGSQR